MDLNIPKNLKTINKRPSFLAAFLHTLPFFKRIQASVIETYVDRFTIEELPMDSILPISGAKNSPVFVILTGKVILRDHLLNDPHDFKVASVASAGTVLGVSHLDCNVSCKPTVWSIVGSYTCVVVGMSK